MLKKNNLPMPTSWQDLLNPVYKGQIVMPNAASSGTGYAQVVSLLQMKGEEKGWQYLKDLDKNIAQYIKSGSRPCKAAATGEYAIGVSFAFSGVKQIMEGYPIKLVIPSEGAGFETEVSALMKTSKNKDDSKQFLDWLLTLDAAKLYGERAEMSSVPGAKAHRSGPQGRPAGRRFEGAVQDGLRGLGEEQGSHHRRVEAEDRTLAAVSRPREPARRRPRASRA